MGPREESDERLMLRVAFDRPEAMNALLRRYASPLLTFIQRLTGDRHRAEDLVQEAFLAVWVWRRRYRYPRPFRPWLFGIVINKCQAEFRRQGHAPTLLDDCPAVSAVAADPAPAEMAVTSETATLVAAALSRLPPRRRMVVVMRIWNGLSYAEIAEAVDGNEATVRSHMFHALAAIRKYLEPRMKWLMAPTADLGGPAMLNANDHVIDYVDGYLHELLSANDAETLEKHCASCKICQVALAEARRALRDHAGLARDRSLGGSIQAAQSKIERHEQRPLMPARVKWLAAAALAVALAGLHVYYLTLSASRYELKVLGQSELLAGSEASLRVLLVNHQNGQPVPGVPVEVDLTDQKANRTVRLVGFTTDRWGSGSPRLRLPNWRAGEYELQVSAQPGRASETIARTIRLKRSWQLMVATDKPVYQPGQVIRMRSLALRGPTSSRSPARR